MTARPGPIGQAWRVTAGTARLLRRLLAVALVVGLLGLNLATLLLPFVYDALRGAVAALASGLGGAAEPDGRTRADGPDGDARARADAEARLRAEADLDAERARSRALLGELDTERVRTGVLSADLDALRRQGDEAADAIDALSSGILRRAARSAARSPGVLIASALPFAGTAVDLAGTALDLNDACEMAGDMTALRQEMGLAGTAEVGPICAAVDSLPTLGRLMDPPEEVPCTIVMQALEEDGLALDPGHCTPPVRPGEGGEPVPEVVEQPDRP